MRWRPQSSARIWSGKCKCTSVGQDSWYPYDRQHRIIKGRIGPLPRALLIQEKKRAPRIAMEDSSDGGLGTFVVQSNYFSVGQEQQVKEEKSFGAPRPAPKRSMKCPICNQVNRQFHCVGCATRILQQRRTTLAALKADVAVLRRKSAQLMHCYISF